MSHGQKMHPRGPNKHKKQLYEHVRILTEVVAELFRAWNVFERLPK